jgi:hypothetical protein
MAYFISRSAILWEAPMRRKKALVTLAVITALAVLGISSAAWSSCREDPTGARRWRGGGAASKAPYLPLGVGDAHRGGGDRAGGGQITVLVGFEPKFSSAAKVTWSSMLW